MSSLDGRLGAKLDLSIKRLLSELDNVRQVVLSKISPLQDKLIDTLGLSEERNQLLG